MPKKRLPLEELQERKAELIHERNKSMRYRASSEIVKKRKAIREAENLIKFNSGKTFILTYNEKKTIGKNIAKEILFLLKKLPEKRTEILELAEKFGISVKRAQGKPYTFRTLSEMTVTGFELGPPVGIDSEGNKCATKINKESWRNLIVLHNSVA
ncbi:MAG: hypothetical protein Q7S21_05605 [archaeon]|nr:hypothetical protein [archaeon]